MNVNNKKIEGLELNDNEIEALKDYQNNYYKIVNTLLRRGITSERTINSKAGSDYIPPSNEELQVAIDAIKNMYSAIIKRTLANSGNKYTKPIYRGTQISLVEPLKENGEETSFLSTTTDKKETIKFSRTFNKNKNIDTNLDKAFLKVVGDVPYINLEEVLGGMEGEIIFAPAKAKIVDGIDEIASDDERHNKLYGKPYTLFLQPLDIPEMSDKDILELKENIFKQNEKMGKTIEMILKMQQQPTMYDTRGLGDLIKEYSDWKDSVIKYCHQEFRKLKREIEEKNSKREVQTEDFMINEYGGIIRPESSEKNFKERYEVDDTIKEHIQEILTQYKQDLENGTFKEEKKKEEDYNPEKGDDDYIL